MFIYLLSWLSYIIVFLLIVLYTTYNTPVKGDGESFEDYEKRKHEYLCNYEGQRNFLLLALGITLVSCMYKACTENSKSIIIAIGGKKPTREEILETHLGDLGSSGGDGDDVSIISDDE